MKIVLAADHGGFELKEKIKAWLESENFAVEDIGARNFDAEDNYPDFVFPLIEKVRADKNTFGIFACRTGTGPVMTANRFRDIRAAVCTTADYARLAREHNNANIIGLGGDVLTFEETREIIKTFLNTRFNGGRHKKRIDMFNNLGQ